MRLIESGPAHAPSRGLTFLPALGAALTLATTSLAGPTNQLRRGLTGVFYGDSDFTRPRKVHVLKTLDIESKNFGSKTWSGDWDGFVIAPVTGKVRFDLRAPHQSALTVGESRVVETAAGSGRRSLTVAMRKGEAYPINVKYSPPPDRRWTLAVRWSWQGKEPAAIPEEALRHSAEQEAKWGVTPEPMLSEVDFSQSIRVPAKQVVVYREPGRFCGWPATPSLAIPNTSAEAAFAPSPPP